MCDPRWLADQEALSFLGEKVSNSHAIADGCAFLLFNQ